MYTGRRWRRGTLKSLPSKVMTGVLELVRLMQKLPKLIPVAFSWMPDISVVLCLSCSVRTRVTTSIVFVPISRRFAGFHPQPQVCPTQRARLATEPHKTKTRNVYVISTTEKRDEICQTTLRRSFVRAALRPSILFVLLVLVV